MSAVSTLQDVFFRQVKESKTTDPDLAAIARLILLESIEKKSGSSVVGSAEQDNKNTKKMAKQALELLFLWDEGDVPMPKTLRVLLDTLLRGWVNSFIDAEIEKEFADTLLALKELDEKEEGQLDEALRHCAKVHLYYQPQKLLRILAGAKDEHNKTVVQWAFKTLARLVPVDHLRFLACCLQACGERQEYPPLLQEAARHHIEAAAKTLSVAEKMHFADVQGGPYRPMDQKCVLRTSGLVDFVWVTSKMNETLKKSEEGTNEWLDVAEQQVLAQLGPREKRGFDIDLIVKIYPHEKDWFARRDEILPLQAVSRSV